MSDPKPTEPVEPTTPGPEPQGEPAGDEPLGDGGKKALQSERERAKELEKQLSAATAKLTEIERANESALDKAQREAQEARDAATKATVEALRYRIAAKHSISDEDATLFLTGGDEETLTLQAERLAERTPPASPTTPKPDRTQGGSGEPPASTAADQFAAALQGRL